MCYIGGNVAKGSSKNTGAKINRWDRRVIARATVQVHTKCESLPGVSRLAELAHKSIHVGIQEYNLNLLFFMVFYFLKSPGIFTSVDNIRLLNGD